MLRSVDALLVTNVQDNLTVSSSRVKQLSRNVGN